MSMSGAFVGFVHLWRSDELSDYQEIAGHSSPVYAISWHPNGRILASGSRFGIIQFWDVIAQQELGSIQYRPFHTIAFSPDGRFLASGGDERYLRIWNTDFESDSFGRCLQVLG